MKRSTIVFVLLLSLQQGKTQLSGFSLNPDLDSKVQLPIRSWPYRTGLSHAFKVSINYHFFYLFRVGAGIGINHASNRLHTNFMGHASPDKIKMNRTLLMVPLHAIGCLPVKDRVMPFVQYQSNLLFSLRQVGTIKYANHTERINYTHSDFGLENNIRMGVLARNDDRSGELSCSLQISFTSTRHEGLRFFGLGLNIQYFFLLGYDG